MNKNISPQRFGFQSLAVRVPLIIFIICSIAGAVLVYLTLNSGQSERLEAEKRVLSITSKRYVTQINALFDEKVSIGLSANQVVTDELFSDELHENTTSAPINAYDDGAIRSTDGYSGAFVPIENFNSEIEKQIVDSEHLWKSLTPVFTQSFYNFYLITKESLIRITPDDWALDVEADHDFEKDLFYSIGTPEQNSEKLPLWTPVYFDDIWQKWMTSLIVPVYKGSEFIGITGSDFVLDSLFEQFEDIGSIESGRRLFIFDKQGNLLVHPDFKDNILSQKGQLNQKIDSSSLINDELKEVISNFTKSDKKELSVRYKEGEKQYLLNVRPVSSMGWYVGVFVSEELVLQELFTVRNQLIFIFIGIAILLSVLLQQVLYHLGFKRINELVTITRDFAKGKLEVDVNKFKRDEIGALGRSFYYMSTEVNELINGLNARIKEKEDAESAARRLSLAVSYAGSGIFITDAKLVIEYVNKSFLNMTSAEEKDFIGKPAASILATQMEFLANDIISDLKEREHWRGDILLTSLDDNPLWVSISIAPIRDEKGLPSHFVASLQDISFVKESQKKMEELAYFDTLTGLANRTYFRTELKKALAMVDRGHFSFALFYFDLDEFKRINDTLGHDAGDQLLVEVANRLKGRLRMEDTIARLGGDEFAVLLSSVSDRDHAAEVAKMIQSTLTKPIRLGANEVIVSASIGITMAQADSKEDVLLKQADLAMYQAKNEGRNTFHFYNEELDLAAKEKLVIETELRSALKNNELVLFYQPQIDANTNQIIGYEALVRWVHPTKGMISPITFIGVAETTGLIMPLGQWVIKEAAEFLARQQKLNNYPLKISVNLSARQFNDENLVSYLKEIIEQTGVESRHIDLEITESMLMGDIDAAIVQLKELKALGFALSIDDFGTGYSSLSYIKRFPVDTLKIDRSFIKDIPEDNDDMEITAAIIAMAQKLSLQLVAEGVETAEQIEFLKQNNCFIMQGYYFGKPVPENELKHGL